MIEHIKEIFRFKEMIKSWTRKELRTRYKGSFFGFLWTFINPLLQLVVYSFIFPLILGQSQESYAMFMFVALIPWNFFTSSIQGTCGLIVWNSSLVTKVYFPREILPISYALSGTMNMIFSYAIVFPMLLLFGVPITWNVLWLPVLIVTQTIFCMGMALLFSSVNVFFRDLEYLISVVIMALYFLTPIMYDIANMPERIRPILRVNPMNSFVELYRDITFYGIGLNISLYFFTLCYSIVIFIIGYLVFGKLQRKFTEVL